MKNKIIFYVLAVIFFFFFLRNWEETPVEERIDSIVCGVYGQRVEVFLAKVLSEKGGIIHGEAYGNNVKLNVVRVNNKMCLDRGKFPRYRIELDVNDNRIVELSHSDIPLALNQYFEGNKYRIICVNNL